jgi:LPXTG-motif cell wall-anchored protein
MRRGRYAFIAVVALALARFFTGPAAAQEQRTTATETRNFEIVSVDGNKVVVKGEKGAQEITVPPDFVLTVDGKSVSVAELKPGMKGTARITTTTTTKPVTVTEVRNGEVMRVTGNSIIVRSDRGIQMFSEADAERRNAAITRDGQPIRFTDLRQGDRLTATIVTSKPPQVMTERQVEAALKSPPAAAAAAKPAPAAPAPAAPARSAPAASAPAAASQPPAGTATTGTTPAPARRLPKTGSSLPTLGLLGAAMLALGATLTARRRFV